MLSAKHTYAIAGIRKELYIWSVETGQLVKCLDAHFNRIIDIQPLTVGSWNSVITSSIDRTVKVWNINYIFEQVNYLPTKQKNTASIKAMLFLSTYISLLMNHNPNPSGTSH